MERTIVIAEIGINHNGDLDIAKKLIDVANTAGCDAVKFQKRTIEQVYSKEQLDSPRESPWGKTNRDQKLGLEFNLEEYQEIDKYCQSLGIEWFASAWDLESQKFLRQFNCKFNKIASAMIVSSDFIKDVASEKKYTFIATGMTSESDIANAVEIFKNADCPFELMHCISTYPALDDKVNLSCINTLKQKFECKVGYSGHEVGLAISLAAVAMGATSIERHITLNRAMYGSDQAASVEPGGLERLVRDIRKIESAMGDGVLKVEDCEKPVAEKLRAHLK